MKNDSELQFILNKFDNIVYSIETKEHFDSAVNFARNVYKKLSDTKDRKTVIRIFRKLDNTLYKKAKEMNIFYNSFTNPFSNESKEKFSEKKEAGMSDKERRSYNRKHGSNLKRAAPNAKPGTKGAKRRKSYCARSKGQMDQHNISCRKTPDKKICKARRDWNCN